MEKIKLAGTFLLIGYLLVGCQMKFPFNRASEKLVTVATSHELPANEEIVIGEFEESEYKVYVNNKAKSPLVVYVVDRSTNKHTQTFSLNAQENATILAAKFEKVIVQNPSEGMINIEIGLSKDVVGWRRQPVKAYASE